MTIRIIAPPRGSSPLEIREAWVGLTLPIKGRRARRKLTCEVTGTRQGALRARFPLIFSAKKVQRVYTVHAKTAVGILAQHRPEAAEWFRQNAPHVLGRLRLLAFQADVCVVESRAYAKPRTGVGIALFIALTMGLLVSLAVYSASHDLYTHAFGIYWDADRGAWLPVSEANVRQTLYAGVVILLMLGIMTSWAVRQYLQYNAWRNRIWRGECGWCGYDVRQTTDRCPECNEPVLASGVSTDLRARGMAPGTKSNLKLLWIVGAAIMAAAVSLVLLVMVGGGGP